MFILACIVLYFTRSLHLSLSESCLSTKSMSDEGGYEIIKMAIRTLGLRHKEHITAYAESNERRLAEKHETAKGCEHGASIHIGQDTEKEGKGYFEDRRSAYGPLRCYFYDS